jgi:hypoxanthine phosphoribosyltransferase
MVKTAVLHIKPWTTFHPNYYVVVTSSWILYPWSRYESWRQLSKMHAELTRGSEAAQTLLSVLGISRERAARLVRDGAGVD